ncbi:MAG: aminoglycoside phosphotransferase family protein [Propionibacteriales bacterium]|nr:aminoglycoside phosphotransferase family protein [Propionibacteriales bacterium]
MMDVEKVRITWAELPIQVRSAVESILGSPVTAADSQPGGYSPGSADRVRTAAGGRAFVKAVGLDLNPDSPGLHRREAAHTAKLPAAAPAPRLLGSYDDGDWVALVLEDVDGAHPSTPWTAADVDAALLLLTDLAGTCTPCPVTDAPDFTEGLPANSDGWRRLADGRRDRLDPWAAAHLDLLTELAARGAEAAAGDTLLHADVRADNLLRRPDGSMVLIDWPWASHGADWVDSMLLLGNIELHGGHDVDALLAAHPLTAAADPADLTGFVAGMTAFFLDQASQPPPPGLPTLRAFQRAQGDAHLRWLRRRVDVP